MKAKVQFKILILIFMAATFTPGLYSQENGTTDPEHSYLWLNAGIGLGSFTSMSGNFGSTFGAGLNYCYDSHFLKGRFVQLRELDLNIFGDSPPPDKVWDIGIMYGLKSTKNKSTITMSAGISYVGTVKNLYVEQISDYYYASDSIETFGIPLEAQVVWLTSAGIGVGVILFGDINSENSFGGVTLNVVLGIMK
jgi:hypothetical protein